MVLSTPINIDIAWGRRMIPVNAFAGVEDLSCIVSISDERCAGTIGGEGLLHYPRIIENNNFGRGRRTEQRQRDRGTQQFRFHGTLKVGYDLAWRVPLAKT